METTAAPRRAIQDDLRITVDALPTLVWRCRPDGSAEFLNQRWLDYTGFSMEQGRGWGWQNAVHPDDLPALMKTWLGLIVSAQPGEHEARLKRFDGVYRWFLFRAEPLRDRSGDVVLWCGTNTDIEDRKAAETLLAGENRVLEMVAKGGPLAATLDAVCRLAEGVSGGFVTSILLLDPVENRLWHAAAPSLPREYVEAIYWVPVGPCVGSCGTAAYRREPVIVSDIETDPLWAEYSQIPLAHDLRACWSTPIFSSENKVLGTFAIYSRQPGSPTSRHLHLIGQITQLASIAIERSRTEAELRRSEAYLAEAQRLSLTGSFGLNIATGEFVWSEQSICILGFNPGAKPTIEMVMQRIHPDDLAYVLQTYKRVKAGLKELDYNHRLLLPDGTVKHLHVIGHATEESTDGVTFVGALMDVTAAMRAEEALHEAQAELAHVTRVMTLGELAGSIAHEVNQPLAAIVTNGEAGLRWLAHETPQVGETRRILKQIVRDAGRAGEVIRRVRNLSKKATNEKAQLDINEAIGEVMPLVQREAANHRVALRLDLTPVLPKVLGDRVQLQQVIINLTINGIESMRDVADRPRQLVIRSKSHGEDRVLVEVVDAGTGIDKDLADRLFNAFFTTKAHGLGMGLSIVRSIIEAHGGRVWASPNDEHGTIFRFTLPSQVGQVP